VKNPPRIVSPEATHGVSIWGPSPGGPGPAEIRSQPRRPPLLAPWAASAAESAARRAALAEKPAWPWSPTPGCRMLGWPRPLSIGPPVVVPGPSFPQSDPRVGAAATAAGSERTVTYAAAPPAAGEEESGQSAGSQGPATASRPRPEAVSGAVRRNLDQTTPGSPIPSGVPEPRYSCPMYSSGCGPASASEPRPRSIGLPDSCPGNPAAAATQPPTRVGRDLKELLPSPASKPGVRRRSSSAAARGPAPRAALRPGLGLVGPKAGHLRTPRRASALPTWRRVLFRPPGCPPAFPPTSAPRSANVRPFRRRSVSPAAPGAAAGSTPPLAALSAASPPCVCFDSGSHLGRDPAGGWARPIEVL